MTTIVRKCNAFNTIVEQVHVKFLYSMITGSIYMNRTPTVTAHVAVLGGGVPLTESQHAQIHEKFKK